MSNQDEPVYSIGVVARMTGIPEPTLRVWERRYAFPQAARTPGGHRLYSQRDVVRLQWVKERVDAGTQISQAIQALQHVEQEGQPPSPDLGSIPSMHTPTVHDASLHTLQKRLLAALLAHDTQAADAALVEAVSFHPLERIALDLFAETLRQIGDLWAAGRADVATEHLATNYLRHHLLIWMYASPPPHEFAPVVLACAPGELHEGGLLIFGLLLRRLRWAVHYLGQVMPLEELENIVHHVRPALVVFAAMSAETATALATWPRWLEGVPEPSRPVIAYGGRAFIEHAELIRQVPGVYLGPTLAEGAEKADQMLRRMNPASP